MPTAYRYDEATRTVRIELSGVVTEGDLFDVARKVATDESIPPVHSELVDLRGVQHTDVTPAALRHLAGLMARAERPERTRVAVCAPADLHFGMSRMYEALREPTGPELRVFRTIEEAEAWVAEPARRET